MKCIQCHNYFRQDTLAPSVFCWHCKDNADDDLYHAPEHEVDMQMLVNPAGRTAAIFYDND